MRADRTSAEMLVLLYPYLLLQLSGGSFEATINDGSTFGNTVKSRCYSCASQNMKENFLTRNRGPRGRVQEPTLYDSMCDLDTWMIREKSAVDCEGPCFKWQQILNNSGVYSYSTIRGCYAKMFGMVRPPSAVTHRAEDPFHSDCSTKEKVLECIDQSTIVEHMCYCRGDFCNLGTVPSPTGYPTALAYLTLCLITGVIIHRVNG